VAVNGQVRDSLPESLSSRKSGAWASADGAGNHDPVGSHDIERLVDELTSDSKCPADTAQRDVARAESTEDSHTQPRKYEQGKVRTIEKLSVMSVWQKEAWMSSQFDQATIKLEAGLRAVEALVTNLTADVAVEVAVAVISELASRAKKTESINPSLAYFDDVLNTKVSYASSCEDKLWALFRHCGHEAARELDTKELLNISEPHVELVARIDVYWNLCRGMEPLCDGSARPCRANR